MHKHYFNCFYCAEENYFSYLAKNFKTDTDCPFIYRRQVLNVAETFLLKISTEYCKKMLSNSEIYLKGLPHVHYKLRNN